MRLLNDISQSFFIIENPASGRIWRYIEEVIGFELPFKNHTYYNNYGYPIRKPTKFAGNIDLKLNAEEVKASKTWQEFSNSYNERSNIPQELVKEIFTKVYCDFLKTRERI